jgi:MFS family permease
MAAPSLLLAWVLWRFLPEPRRGGQSWLKAGEEDPEAAARSPKQEAGAGKPRRRQPMATLYKKMRAANVKPRPEKILKEDPTGWNLWRTMHYLLSLPTYPLLIVASTLAYFFFAGAEAFAMIYFPPHYGVSRSVLAALIILLGIGALIGLLTGGYLSRRLLRAGEVNARIIVPAVALFISIPFFAVAIWVPVAWVGIPLLVVGAAALTTALAPIDAARLDIIHPRLWGRGEAGRMALRSAFEGAAPLLFGAMSGWLGGGTQGLMWTFLIMLLPMVLAAALVVPGLRTYPRDVATAAASIEAKNAEPQQSGDALPAG